MGNCEKCIFCFLVISISIVNNVHLFLANIYVYLRTRWESVTIEGSPVLSASIVHQFLQSEKLNDETKSSVSSKTCIQSDSINITYLSAVKKTTLIQRENDYLATIL